MGTDESILDIIPNASRKKGWFKQQTWNLVFTNRRMIAALLTDQAVKAEAASAAQAAQAHRADALERMWSTALAGVNLHKKYLSMPVEQILAENPENFAVELSQIESVKTAAGEMAQAGKWEPDTLTIRTTSDKMEFQLGLRSLSASEATTILRPIIRNRIK
jgi:hypothetical protein